MSDDLESDDPLEQLVLDITQPILTTVINAHLKVGLNTVCMTFVESHEDRPVIAMKMCLHSDWAAVTALNTLIEALGRLANQDPERENLRALVKEMDATLERMCLLLSANEGEKQ